MTTKKLTLTLSAAAAIGVLAAGGAAAFATVPTSGPEVKPAAATAPAPAADPVDAKIAKECVQADQHVPDPASWRPAARLDVDAQHGFLAIRNDKLAAVCVIENGHGTGIMGGVGTNHNYGKLTDRRPFDYLDAMNYPDGQTVQFGIATGDVAKVSLIGPDGSATPTVLKDGTFIAKTKFGEDSNQPTTNHVRATLANGSVVDGPFRA